jgi:tetratricopeptide (TPR) repeat protein
MKAEATSKQAQVEAARTRLELLEGFLREDPDNSTLLGDAFMVALKCGDWKGAQALLTHAQGRHPGNDAWALREGDYWLAQHRYDEARIVLQRLALLAEPASPLANVVAQNLAHVDFCQLDYAACIAKLEPLMPVPAELGGDIPIGATQQLWLRALHRNKDLARACQWASEADRAGQLDPGAAGVASLAAIDHCRIGRPCADLPSACSGAAKPRWAGRWAGYRPTKTERADLRFGMPSETACVNRRRE